MATIAQRHTIEWAAYKDREQRPVLFRIRHDVMALRSLLMAAGHMAVPSGGRIHHPSHVRGEVPLRLRIP